jgi:aryl-alcohol dehydrogenase-like predicted oxidoreductase
MVWDLDARLVRALLPLLSVWSELMRYRALGRTGLRVSELCLGGLTFGTETDETGSHRILDTFVERGGNFVDTADVYGRGVSEEVLGRWLAKQRREDLVIATKVRGRMGDQPNDYGLGRKHVLAAVDASLRRLRTDYIDLYQIHAADPETPLNETLATLDGLVRGGKVRYVGASNMHGWQLQKAIGISARYGWEPFVCMQPVYNLLVRDVEFEILPVCRSEQLGVIPWSPLASGWLSGKFRRGMTEPPSDTRIAAAESRGMGETWANYANEHTWSVLDVLFTVAEETGRTPAQVALNWVLKRPEVTAPIIGARTLEQLDDNLGAVSWSLTVEQQSALEKARDSVTVRPLPYPYS